MPETSIDSYFAMSLSDAIRHLFPDKNYTIDLSTITLHQLPGVPSLAYAPAFLTPEEQAAVTWLMDMAPPHKWVMLSGR